LLDKQRLFHKIKSSRLVDSPPLRLAPLRPASVSLLTGWFMTHRQDAALSRDLVARWCALAEQRLDYLTAMFESGRWRRYYGELAFLENIQEAKTAVEKWRRLSAPGAAPEDPAVDIAWQAMPSASVMVRPAFDVPVTAEKDFVAADQAPRASMVDLAALEQALNEVLVPALSAIEQRYPLLRNAL
jgi:hypothetical protein